ncbi:hypothetical protein EI94DRAFT_683964 [Lactarius quietus]|nr:hypothetical protein EI94DRAFT_683964 [Lactarius quietus]
MSFEQALQAGGTVVIKEGIDVDALGQDLAPPANNLSSPPTNSHSMVQSPSSAQLKTSPTSPASRPPASASTSASSSSNDLFYDAEDPEYQSRRRSMYRSQGTASSPDLATLVRKAKQRGRILPTGKDRRQETAPPLPSGPHAPSDLSSRPRNASSASSSGYSVPTVSPPPMPKGRGQRSRPSAGPSSGSDWVLASSSHDDETAKNPKASVRQKTSAFLGRMLGQNTMRERSKTTSSPSRQRMQLSPPVPPKPTDSASPTVVPASEALPTSPKLDPVHDTPVTLKLPPLETEANVKGRGVVTGEPPLTAIERNFLDHLKGQSTLMMQRRQANIWQTSKHVCGRS